MTQNKDYLLWLGAATFAFKNEDNRIYKIGLRKVTLLHWLWENRKNLPKNTRILSYKSGLSSDKSQSNSTVSSTVKILIEHGLMQKQEGKYILVMPTFF